MKVFTEEPKAFKPITIVLETEEEANELCITLGKVSGCYQLWKLLTELLEDNE